MIGAGCMLTLQLTMWVYVKMFGVAEEKPAKEVETKEEAGKDDDDDNLEGKSRAQAMLLLVSSITTTRNCCQYEHDDDLICRWTHH